MAKKPTRPLKVTAHLRDGRLNSADGLVMLDGIAYHAWFCAHAPEVLEGRGSGEWGGHVGLPLRQNPGNVWSASRAVYEEDGRGIAYYNRRPDFFDADKLGMLGMDGGLISSSVGAYRAYRMPQVVRVVRGGAMAFWCMGDADALGRLLESMAAVGKKASMGYGFVDRWEIEDADGDYSFWHPEHGLMRPVPVDGDVARERDLSGYPVFRCRVTPPYWKEGGRVPCYVPVGGAP